MWVLRENRTGTLGSRNCLTKFNADQTSRSMNFLRV